MVRPVSESYTSTLQREDSYTRVEFYWNFTGMVGYDETIAVAYQVPAWYYTVLYLVQQ